MHGDASVEKGGRMDAAQVVKPDPAEPEDTGLAGELL
jgi:hypothetical protein